MNEQAVIDEIKKTYSKTYGKDLRSAGAYSARVGLSFSSGMKRR